MRHAGGTGRVGAYVRALAEDGLVGVALAQSPATVAPYGGTAPVVGTNPLAVAVPRAGRGRALVVDAATSAVTLADARRRAREGTPLPDGAALGPDGEPTGTRVPSVRCSRPVCSGPCSGSPWRRSPGW